MTENAESLYFTLYDQMLTEQSGDQHWWSLSSRKSGAALRLFTDADWRELTREWRSRNNVWRERFASTLGKIFERRGFQILWMILSESEASVAQWALDSLLAYYQYTDLEMNAGILSQVRDRIINSSHGEWSSSALSQVDLMMTPRKEVLPCPWGISEEQARQILFPPVHAPIKVKESKVSSVHELHQLPEWAQEKIKILADNDDENIKKILFESRAPSLRNKSIYELFQSETKGQFESIVGKHLDKLMDFYFK